MNALTAAVSHEKLQGLGKQHLQGLVRKWYNPSLVENLSQALFEGIGLVRVTEGDLATLDGNFGMIYAGAINPVEGEIHSLLTDITMVAAVRNG